MIYYCSSSEEEEEEYWYVVVVVAVAVVVVVVVAVVVVVVSCRSRSCSSECWILWVQGAGKLLGAVGGVGPYIPGVLLCNRNPKQEYRIFLRPFREKPSRLEIALRRRRLRALRVMRSEAKREAETVEVTPREEVNVGT